MFVTNCISTTKIQKISEITNFFRHYFLSRTEVKDTQVAQFIATARLHLSLFPVIIDDSYLPQYKTLNLFKKERLRGYFLDGG